MRAGRKGGFRGEFRHALHILRFFLHFLQILNFARNCGSFYLKFELFSLKIRNNEERAGGGLGGWGKDSARSHYLFLW